MKNRGITYYRLVAGIIIMLLIAPIAQETFGLFSFKPLEGEYKKHNKPSFSVETWLTQAYQDSVGKYTISNFGFSTWLTRFHNQYVFELFHNSRSPSVVIGKQNEIYDYGHIQAYLGNDFLGEEQIEYKIHQVEEINKSLKKYNTEIVLVIAPSKPSIMPEYLPDKYKSSGAMNNYEVYIDKLKNGDITYIDFSAVFKQWKKNKPLPLYPQCGVHWSEYGATLAADSMLHFMQKALNANVPSLKIDSTVITDQLSKSDYDMGAILNLLFPIQPYPMGYPVVSFDGEPSRTMDVLTIGDSYYWIWYNEVGFDQKCFKSNLFLEYFSKAHSSQQDSKSINEIDVLEETIQSEMILIVCSESNLYRLGYGYIEFMYSLIPEMNRRYLKKMQEYRQSIRQDEQWMKSIREKADKKGISIDSMLTLDAIYLIEQN